ncbi:hypothetical protein SUGI_0804430 [Cryptomeria japonica]|uniref:RING-H2 finger protein ATL52 n=1 Tax=Cryptomeria japonica TaxID=3369 RepID=UPI002414A75D|nr:RING-H2 finger protein ATL52 [Cryptomeria japonica]GLJ39390.1 hypothetical protein SUGI_0804430 [Cryptomeria japonica]
MGTPEYPPTVFTFFNFSDCEQSLCTPFCPDKCLPFPPPPPFEILEHDSDPNFSPLVIAIIGILASTFLLVSYYTIVAKYCTNWESLRRRLRRSGNDTFDDDDSQVAPNDSWPLVTTGLEESVIRSIPVCKFKKGDGLVDCTDCSVCLSEFQEDESVRLLPKCNHAFHLPCIDTWLQSHSNCPLCRAYIVSPPAENRILVSPEEPDSSPPPSDNQEPNLREEARSNSSRCNLSRANSSRRNLSRANSLANLPQVHETGSSEVVDRKEESDRIEKENQVFKALASPRFRALSDLASKHRVDDSITEFTGELQPIRRSVSLGSSNRFCISINDLMAMQVGFEHGDPNALEQNAAPPESSSSHRKTHDHEFLLKGFGKHLGQYQNKYKVPGEVSKSGILHNLKGPFTMKRSFSGRKFFLSRHNRSRNAILPI